MTFCTWNPENFTLEDYELVISLAKCSHCTLKNLKSHFLAVSHHEHSELQVGKFTGHEMGFTFTPTKNCLLWLF